MLPDKKILDITLNAAFTLLGIPRLGRKPKMYRRAKLMYNTSRERKILYRIAAVKRPEYILEIGTCYGHTAYGFKINSPASKVYTIDIHKEMGIEVPENQADQLLPRENVGKIFRENGAKIFQIFGDSREKSTYRGLPDFDLAFIDGNHSAASIIADTKNVFVKTRKNAIIIWHDYRNDGLAETISALHEIIKTYDIHIFHIEGTMLAFTVKNSVYGF